jgi:hypothetical protein
MQVLEHLEFLDSKLSDVDLFRRPGWKTQDIRRDSDLQKLDIEAKDETFLGFGNCPHEVFSVKQFRVSIPVEDQVKSYLIPLRAQCNEDLVETLVSLVEGGALSPSTFSYGGKYDFFKVIPDWKIL